MPESKPTITTGKSSTESARSVVADLLKGVDSMEISLDVAITHVADLLTKYNNSLSYSFSISG